MNHNSYEAEPREMIDIVDCDGITIGTAEKEVAHKLGLWHKSFHCWIIQEISSKYYVLYQKRGRSKQICPNLYDISVAGHYSAAEGIEGGLREIREEIGIDVSLDNLINLGKKYDIFKSSDIINYEICDVMLLKLNTPIAELKLAYPELEGIAMVELDNALMLFGNKIDMISASAILWNHDDQSWENCEVDLTTDSFISRADNYFFKILTTINSYTNGHLSINF